MFLGSGLWVVSCGRFAYQCWSRHGKKTVVLLPYLLHNSPHQHSLVAPDPLAVVVVVAVVVAVVVEVKYPHLVVE